MRFTKMHGAGNDYVYVNCFDEPMPDRPGRTGPPGLRPAFRHRRRRPDPDLPQHDGRRPHADVQRRRLGGGNVRQRHPLRGQVRLRPRHLPQARRCGSKPATACSAWNWKSPTRRSAACGSTWASRSSSRPASPSDSHARFPAIALSTFRPSTFRSASRRAGPRRLRLGLADDVRFDGQSALRHVLSTASRRFRWVLSWGRTSSGSRSFPSGSTCISCEVQSPAR